MFSLHSKLSDNFILFILASFAFMSILGMGMSMKVADGQMSSCLFMAGQATMCQMNVIEHIAQWQQAFLGMPTKTNFLVLIIVLLAIVIIPFAKLFQLRKLTELVAQLFAHQQAHFVKVFNPLLLAFSDGILHPRIYEPARL